MSQLSRGEILGRLAVRESLRGVSLVRASLSEIGLIGADLTEANLRMADLDRADLRDARLAGSRLNGASLNGANLTGCNLVEATMIGVSLKEADLSRADLSGADLTGANLDGAKLIGAYLVGAFLNETSLNSADMSGAYMRMAQIAGSNLTNTVLEGADLSQTDLSGVHLDGSLILKASLSGASLSSSYLTNCDLRGADLSDADLSGCNLTGAKLHGIKFAGVKLDDAWAEWVDLSEDGSGNHRAPLEEAFAYIIGQPMAQILVEGLVTDDVWTEILSHLREFQLTHPHQADVRLRAIQQGVSSAALYLEADREVSIAAYLAEFADIVGKGSVELFEKLAAIVAERNGDLAVALGPSSEHQGNGFTRAATRPESASRVETLQNTEFWNSEKAFAILTGNRRVWLEATSSEMLTLRPPHGVVTGVDLIRGRFVASDNRRTRQHGSLTKDAK